MGIFFVSVRWTPTISRLLTYTRTEQTSACKGAGGGPRRGARRRWWPSRTTRQSKDGLEAVLKLTQPELPWWSTVAYMYWSTFGDAACATKVPPRLQQTGT